MTAPKCTDQEFVALWKELGGAAAVAKHLGVNERSVHQRRRNLEKRHDFNLIAHHHYKHAPAETARRQITVQDGTIVVFSDAHFWPGVRTTAFRALVHLLPILKPSVVVCNGDAFDGASISRYPRIGWDSKPSVIEELKACKDALGEIAEAANGAKLYWPLGNHDSRFETRLAASAPEFEGVSGFHLKDHFPDWVPCWSVWVNDDIAIKHRYRNGIHATHNNTVWAGKTIVTGHLHSLKVTPLSDYNGTRFGVDTGTLADPHGPQFIDYLEDNPVNWRSGFVVLTIKNGKLLWPEVVAKFDEGRVEFRGELVRV